MASATARASSSLRSNRDAMYRRVVSCVRAVQVRLRWDGVGRGGGRRGRRAPRWRNSTRGARARGERPRVVGVPPRRAARATMSNHCSLLSASVARVVTSDRRSLALMGRSVHEHRIVAPGRSPWGWGGKAHGTRTRAGSRRELDVRSTRRWRDASPQRPAHQGAAGQPLTGRTSRAWSACALRWRDAARAAKSNPPSSPDSPWTSTPSPPPCSASSESSRTRTPPRSARRGPRCSVPRDATAPKRQPTPSETLDPDARRRADADAILAAVPEILTFATDEEVRDAARRAETIRELLPRQRRQTVQRTTRVSHHARRARPARGGHAAGLEVGRRTRRPETPPGRGRGRGRVRPGGVARGWVARGGFGARDAPTDGGGLRRRSTADGFPEHPGHGRPGAVRRSATGVPG